MKNTGYKVKGKFHEFPLYDKNGNWCTEVFVGDRLIVNSGGFGSELLEYAGVYTVIEEEGEIKLLSKDGIKIDAWNTKNTMPFFLKMMTPEPNKSKL